MFDSEARLPLDSELVRTAHEMPLIVVVSRACPTGRVGRAAGAGAEIVTAPGGNEAGAGRDALDKLGELGIQSMLLEGGPRLAGAFLDAGEIDEMRIFIAPIALGGRSARVPFEGEGSESIAARSARSRCPAEPVGERRPDPGADERMVKAGASMSSMFTGLVQEVGTVRRAVSSGDGEDARLRVDRAARRAVG